MTKTILCSLMLALAPAAYAGETSRSLKGVEMPASSVLDGKTLVLNGLGLRTKVVFKVYVGALYLEKASSDGPGIAASEQVKRMDLVFLRGVGGAEVGEAITGGFAANAGAGLAALKDRMALFVKMIPDVKKGDRLTFIYRPGAGLELQANGRKTGAIEGKDFSDTLFRVWLGGKPADKDLKAGLLGK